MVFGCGGDRDKTKRARMGEIAGELSDLAVITSDNPRSEPPGEIIAQVAGGVRGGNCMLIENRAEAIRYAIDVCRKDDTVVIAGKGHETTQEIDGVKYAFSDIDTVRSILG